MAKEYFKQFGTIKAELCVPEPTDRDQSSWCTLSWREDVKDRYGYGRIEHTSSLALAWDRGGIVDDNDNLVKPMADRTLSQIQNWADRLGY